MICCACTRARVIYSLEADATCVLCVRRVHYVSRLHLSPYQTRWQMQVHYIFVLCSLTHLSAHSNSLFCLRRFAFTHGTEWVRSHLFYELAPATPTPLHQHTHTKGPSRAIPACVSNVENTGKNSVVGRFFTFSETFPAVLWEMVLVEVINLELNLACTDVRVCMLVWWAQAEIRSPRWNFTLWICLTNDVATGA
jgi:hypothetical protein